MSGKKKQTWKPVNMAAAMSSIREKEMGYLKASTIFNVPNTLERYVKKINK